MTSSRTITATLTDEQYADLQMAAEEAGERTKATEAMEAITQGWEEAGYASVHYSARHEHDMEVPRVQITVSAEVSGNWVEPGVIADTTRQLVASLTSRLREAANNEPTGRWLPGSPEAAT